MHIITASTPIGTVVCRLLSTNTTTTKDSSPVSHPSSSSTSSTSSTGMGLPPASNHKFNNNSMKGLLKMSLKSPKTAMSDDGSSDANVVTVAAKEKTTPPASVLSSFSVIPGGTPTTTFSSTLTTTTPTRGRTFESLPRELRLRILGNLSLEDLASAARVSKAWMDVAYDGALWQVLDFRRTKVGPEHIPTLAKRSGRFLKHLNAATSKSTPFTSTHLRAFALHCPNIQHAHLPSFPTLSSFSLASFLRSTAASLQTLVVKGVGGVTDTSLKILSRHTALTSLDVSHCESLTSEGLQRLVGACVNLKKLKMVKVGGVDDGVLGVALRRLPKLESLNVGCCGGVTGDVFAGLLRTPGQRNQQQQRKQEEMTGEEEMVVVCGETLRYLNLGGIEGVGDSSLAGLGGWFPNLETVELAGCRRITDAGVFALVSGCAKISKLDLEECASVSDEGLDSVGRWVGKSLKVLRVGFCEQLTDDGLIRLLSTCTNLTHISFDNCPLVSDRLLNHVTSARISHLLPKLCMVELYDCRGVSYGAVRSLLKTNKKKSVGGRRSQKSRETLNGRFGSGDRLMNNGVEEEDEEASEEGMDGVVEIEVKSFYTSRIQDAVFASAEANITDVATFDAYLQSQQDQSTTFVNSMRQIYGCSGFKGNGLRYHMSTLCNYFVSASLAVCPPPPTPYTPLCQSSCMSYFDTMRTTFNDTTLCPQPADPTILDARTSFFDPVQSPYFAYCLTTPLGEPPVCQLGVTTDTKNLGFPVAADAVAYCTTTPTGKNDTLCPAFVDGYLKAVVKSLNPVSDMPWMLSGAAAAGMLFLFFAFSFWIRFTRWRAATTVAYQPQESYGTLKLKKTRKSFFGGSSNRDDEQQKQQQQGRPRYANQNIKGFTGTIARGPGQPSSPTARSGPKQRASIFSTVRASIQGYSNLEPPPLPKTPTNNNNNESRYTFDPSAVPLTPVSPSSSGKVQMRVVESYTATMDDEVSLTKGDVVTVLETFDDGWCLGRNESLGGVEGVLPLACLAGLDDAAQGRGGGGGRRSVVGGRVSSLYLR
ncbi:hypothetical protein HDV05_005710 [Chytridiales sp. JEL 0842]|nr:hypothetical protein HDV05_005710 [Chytridiales sp. JEL 0842]